MGYLIYSQKYLTLLNVMKYDGVIKQVTWPLSLLWCFLKGLMWDQTRAKFHSYGLTGSEFMEGDTFVPRPPLQVI